MTFSDDLDVRVTDTCLRDGSHAVRHQLTTDQVRSVVVALDDAGVPVLEVAHGDGLGGSSFTYGFSRSDERELIAVAVQAARRARIAALLLPGIGTTDDLRAVAELGVGAIRVATHCSEADVGVQHLSLARDLGLEAIGFLMMAHSQAPELLAEQARIMADAGATCIYVVDSAGAMVPPQAAARVAAVRDALAGDAQVGFHGHENLACGVANTLAAIDAGAVQVDASARRMGAGAGNTPTEALAAVLEKLALRTGIDVGAMADAAEDAVRPIMEGECVLDRMALTLGWAGVYSSFLKHAARAAERHGVSGPEILRACGRRGLVGGQEDLIGEIAYELASRR
ncbi:4-hydroxy-2-oxovalerate aldolase [Capillimicrobium parvum]|uniref:4-hydroxy-2-oxovalerate aldolase n=1 Tax=Capillimicrobium parvum TaxID=2884022 RepID=A0A9E7C2A0_9ACTN|nr:4-hydroxy-2-oxovalerate aldolase [Capillimicrobium parvum]UGS38236.1 4-hydroxy-2-oxovalerate aldolase [Capillimicrobium parvum]